MATNPNNDSWVRKFLEAAGEDPDQEAMDPFVPDSWREEPGFMAASRLELTEDAQARLADYQGAGLRAELRVVEIDNVPTNYLVLFINPEQSGETG
jgi:hypothetical protein